MIGEWSVPFHRTHPGNATQCTVCTCVYVREAALPGAARTRTSAGEGGADKVHAQPGLLRLLSRQGVVQVGGLRTPLPANRNKTINQTAGVTPKWGGNAVSAIPAKPRPCPSWSAGEGVAEVQAAPLASTHGVAVGRTCTCGRHQSCGCSGLGISRRRGTERSNTPRTRVTQDKGERAHKTNCTQAGTVIDPPKAGATAPSTPTHTPHIHIRYSPLPPPPNPKTVPAHK
jgi:hypothetical protein